VDNGHLIWLFAGSEGGGRSTAKIYTITQTATRNGHDPEAYLADILARLADHPINKIDELLPWRWQPKAPAQAATEKAASITGRLRTIGQSHQTRS
jgi:transposase